VGRTGQPAFYDIGDKIESQKEKRKEVRRMGQDGRDRKRDRESGWLFFDVATKLISPLK